MNFLIANTQFSSVTQPCLILCDPMDGSTPGFPVHHQLPELAQTHVYRISHLILCHPLLLLPSILPRIGSFPMSQFFLSGGQSFGVSASASVLPMNFQDLFPLGLTGLISWFENPRDSQKSSSTLQFKSINSSVLSFLYSLILTSIHDYCKNRSLTRWTFVGKVMFLLFPSFFNFF